MTPLTITVLLHCYTSQAPVPNARAPAVKDTIIWLIRERMILPVQGVGDVYATTERGVAHIVQLCKTRMPSHQWLDSAGQAINLEWDTGRNTEPDKRTKPTQREQYVQDRKSAATIQYEREKRFERSQRARLSQDQLNERIKRELDNVVIRHKPNTEHTAELGGDDDTPLPPLPAAPSCECNAPGDVHHPDCPASEFEA